MVSGTSPSVRAGARVLRSQITMGGIQKPPALTHPTTVICDLSPDDRATGFQILQEYMPLGGFGFKGTPVSSILKIKQG